MNAHPIAKVFSLAVLMMLIGLNSPLLAQSKTTGDEDVSRYEELLKYRDNVSIEESGQADRFSETVTGIGSRSVADVFLSNPVLSHNLADLKMAWVFDPSFGEGESIGSYEFGAYDDFFAGKSSGSKTGFSAGHCPKGGVRY